MDYIGSTTQDVLGDETVGRRVGQDANDADARVVLRTIVGSVAEVTQPGLESWAVVLFDEVAVGDDVGAAGDGSPLARGVGERDVDAGVLVDVVRLARLGVGVEEKINATSFLRYHVNIVPRVEGASSSYSGRESHASGDEVTGLGLVGGEHAKLAPGDELYQVVDLGLEIRRIGISSLVRVGRGIASRGIGEGHVCDGRVSEICWVTKGLLKLMFEC